MKLSKSLETKRLSLRTLAADDATDRYVGWLNDPEINKYLEVRFVPQTIESVRSFIGSMNDSPDNLLLGIFLKEDGAHVGNIKLGPIDPYHHRSDIGIVIGDRDQWGKGLATEAIIALSDHALGEMGLHKVYAGFYEGNVGSSRAFSKSGFVEEARLREHRLCDGNWQDEILLSRMKKAD